MIQYNKELDLIILEARDKIYDMQPVLFEGLGELYDKHIKGVKITNEDISNRNWKKLLEIIPSNFKLDGFEGFIDVDKFLDLDSKYKIKLLPLLIQYCFDAFNTIFKEREFNGYKEASYLFNDNVNKLYKHDDRFVYVDGISLPKSLTDIPNFFLNTSFYGVKIENVLDYFNNLIMNCINFVYRKSDIVTGQYADEILHAFKEIMSRISLMYSKYSLMKNMYNQFNKSGYKCDTGMDIFKLYVKLSNDAIDKCIEYNKNLKHVNDNSVYEPGSIDEELEYEKEHDINLDHMDKKQQQKFYDYMLTGGSPDKYPQEIFDDEEDMK